MRNIHLNEETKVSIRKGIQNYLDALSRSQTPVPANLIFDVERIPEKVKISERRLKDVQNVLGLVDQIHFSHQELEEQVQHYLKTIKTGGLRRSKLRDYIGQELAQINTKFMDRELLRDHQVLVNSDLYQQIVCLKKQLNKAMNDFQRAKTAAIHWKQRVNHLEGLFSQMEEIDQEYKKAQEILKAELALLRSKLDTKTLDLDTHAEDKTEDGDASESCNTSRQSSMKNIFDMDEDYKIEDENTATILNSLS